MCISRFYTVTFNNTTDGNLTIQGGFGEIVLMRGVFRTH